MKTRLQILLARAGIASRRSAEEMIRQGRVCVNGRVVTELGSRADPAADRITVDGVELAEAENKVYVMLHKPPGCITSLHDPEGRPTVSQLIKGIPERVVPVGRLDYDTEGLLVLTNDGRFSQLLQHPRYAIPRTYLVKVQATPRDHDLGLLESGIMLDGAMTAPCRISVVKKTAKNSWCSVVLHEGRNRQIKYMFEHIGHRVLRIIRTEFGPLTLANLPQGTCRFLKKSEIDAIREAAGTAAQQPRRAHARTHRPGRRPAGQHAARRPEGYAQKHHGPGGRPSGADTRPQRKPLRPAARPDSGSTVRRQPGPYRRSAVPAGRRSVPKRSR